MHTPHQQPCSCSACMSTHSCHSSRRGQAGCGGHVCHSRNRGQRCHGARPRACPPQACSPHSHNGCGGHPQNNPPQPQCSQQLYPPHQQTPNHRCCDGRKHCDTTWCPQSHVLHPAIGIPLSICTAGLSCAALGIYKGVANHKIRKALRDAQRLQGSDEKDYLTPNALAAAPTANKRSKLLAEMESPTAPQKHQNRDEKSDIVSEPDSTPLDARPPSYAEVEYQDRK